MHLCAFALSLLFLAGLACSLPGRNAAPSVNGAVGILSRQLDLVEKGIDPASLVQVGDPVQLLAGELVRVSNGGEALLDYGDQLQVRLFNDTSTNLVEAASVPGTPLSVQLYLELGGMTGRLKSPGGSLQVRTPGGAQVLVLGTRFFVIYDPATRITWAGNFEGLMGVAAGGENAQLPSGYYLMVPAGERPGPPLPLPFDQVQLEARARQQGSASAALARLALVGLPSTPWASLLTDVPRGTVAVITPRVTEILPAATQAPAPAGDTVRPPQESPERRPAGTVPARPQPRDTVKPYITVLDPSLEPVGVGRTCPPGAGVVRLKSVVFDPSGVSSVTASWSLASLPGAPLEQGVEELRRNEKGNYIGEIGPFDSPGRLQVVLAAVDGAGNRGSAPPFSVDLSTCPDRSTPVIGVLQIDPQVMPGQVCAGVPTRLEIKAPVSDDGQLDKVLAAWEVAGQSYSAGMVPGGEGLYQAELLLESPAGQVPLRIQAYDSAGNRADSTLALLVENCQAFPTITPTPTDSPTPTPTPTDTPNLTPTETQIPVELPDLLPVPDDLGSYCKRDLGILVVTVRNQGNYPAGPSLTAVDFGEGENTRDTPELSPGASVDLLFEIPLGCFSENCGFKIAVDSQSVVDEADEGNNTAGGDCPG